MHPLIDKIICIIKLILICDHNLILCSGFVSTEVCVLLHYLCLKCFSLTGLQTKPGFCEDYSGFESMLDFGMRHLFPPASPLHTHTHTFCFPELFLLSCLSLLIFSLLFFPHSLLLLITDGFKSSGLLVFISCCGEMMKKGGRKNKSVTVSTCSTGVGGQ